jgi:uncharacterized protein (DUF362 family)/NAD-dependent dihydropyrimidine dehydrogenase PreA subunit
LSKVAIVQCEDYSASTVQEAVTKFFDLLELKKLIKPGQKVLLKPNLLLNFAPSKGVTTHPAVVKAVAGIVKECGGFPFVGDSPGGIGSMYKKVIRETGMDALGIPVADFESKGMKKFDNPGGKMDPIYISNEALSYDLIINIAKMKTHELTRITCGIKNMFGCVPGLHKVSYHLNCADPVDFAKALVELFGKIKPAITIIDAVVAMEGNGPSNGKLREVKKLIASADAVSVDAVCSKMMGIEPLEIDTTRFADQMGLGEGHLEHIEIVGGPLESLNDFQVSRPSRAIMKKIPKFLLDIIKRLIESIKPRPKINREKCVKCMMCVNSCPAKAIDGITFKIDPDKCIMCFCCRELCRYGAVKMNGNFLYDRLR